MSGKQSSVEFKQMEKEFTEYLRSEMLQDQILMVLLSVIQDGICFITKDMDVVYENPAMRYWYEIKPKTGVVKCYDLYHNRKTPCDQCPLLRAKVSKKAEIGEQIYELNRKKKGMQEIFCIPILNNKQEIVLFIEYIRDLTSQSRNDLAMELMSNSLRTMTVYIEKKEKEYHGNEQLITNNINNYFSMLSRYLQKALDPEHYELISRQLDISKQFIGSDPVQKGSLIFSEQELLIARYIADGYMSKEIAAEMQISKKTVDYHRTNLRKKLQLNTDDSLKQALREYFLVHVI